MVEPSITYTNPTGDFSIQIGDSWDTHETAERVEFTRTVQRSHQLSNDSLCDPKEYEEKVTISIWKKTISFCVAKDAASKCTASRKVVDQDSIESYLTDAADHAGNIQTLDVGGRTPLVLGSQHGHSGGPCTTKVLGGLVIANDGQMYGVSFLSEEATKETALKTLKTFRLLE